MGKEKCKKYPKNKRNLLLFGGEISPPKGPEKNTASQASKPCVVSGFLLVRLIALAHHLEVCASVMGRTKRACHLHPILCTWDALITCTPVTVFFPLGVRLQC